MPAVHHPDFVQHGKGSLVRCNSISSVYPGRQCVCASAMHSIRGCRPPWHPDAPWQGADVGTPRVALLVQGPFCYNARPEQRKRCAKGGGLGKERRTMRHPRAVGTLLTAALASVLVLLGVSHGQQVHRNPFETLEPSWVKGPADVPFKEIAHDITDAAAGTG